MNKEIKKTVDTLKNGGIVIFPTDTAFGIGCMMDNEDAVKRLYTLRKRPEEKAVPVLVDTAKMAQEFLEPIPKDVLEKLIEPYWPGALTIVLSCKTEKVPSLVRGGGTTIGVRIPNHPIARALIRVVGKPILGPSANFAGEKTPYTVSDLDPELVSQVDYALDGETKKKQVSTVIDCTKEPWKILRQGAIQVSI